MAFSEGDFAEVIVCELMVQTLAELRAEEDDKNDNEKTDSGRDTDISL